MRFVLKFRLKWKSFSAFVKCGSIHSICIMLLRISSLCVDVIEMLNHGWLVDIFFESVISPNKRSKNKQRADKMVCDILLRLRWLYFNKFSGLMRLLMLICANISLLLLEWFYFSAFWVENAIWCMASNVSSCDKMIVYLRAFIFIP